MSNQENNNYNKKNRQKKYYTNFSEYNKYKKERDGNIENLPAMISTTNDTWGDDNQDDAWSLCVPEHTKNLEEKLLLFEEMDLNQNILRGIFSYGFEKPSVIQSKVIPRMMKGVDIIAQSQSGTGKTATFIVGSLQVIYQNSNNNSNGINGIILSPVREISIQIYNVFKELSTYTNIKPILCVGGIDNKSIINEINNLSKKYICVLIGTPGKLYDMLNRNMIDIYKLKILVLDEADELLSPNFIPQIKYIITQLSEKCQICLFSATLPDNVLDISQNFMNNPEMILIKPEEVSLDGITQYYIHLNEKYEKISKFDVLINLYEKLSFDQSIIYVNTKYNAINLKQKLINNNFTVSMIHSEMSHLDRTNVMNDFRKGKSRILISTDLLSRGIDIQQISTVINYDIPYNSLELYIHRIGRTGRFGRKGVAINLTSNKDLFTLKKIEKLFSTTIIQLYPNKLDIING